MAVVDNDPDIGAGKLLQRRAQTGAACIGIDRQEECGIICAGVFDIRHVDSRIGHDEAELVRALGLPSPLLGVNNRDLRTFTTDLGVTERLADMTPPGKLLISESGVRSAADIARLRLCGARGFLVGESLMRAENPVESVRSLAQVR